MKHPSYSPDLATANTIVDLDTKSPQQYKSARNYKQTADHNRLVKKKEST